MKKVLFVIDSLNGGGAEKILLEIINSLNPKEYQVDLMTVWNRGDYISQLPSTIPYHTIVKRPGNKWFDKLYGFMIEKSIKYLSCRLLHALFRPGKYDVEIAFLEGASTKIVAGATCKKYAWVHTDMKSNTWYEQFYRNKRETSSVYNRFTEVIYVSKSLNDSFEERYGKVRSRVIHNPLDTKTIKLKSEFPCNFEIDNSCTSIVSVGRLEKEKGFDRLIDIAADLKEKAYKFNIYIIGKGREESHLYQLCIEKQVKDCVHLIGFYNNPYPIIKQMDIFVCPSRVEGYSTVVAEALVLGLPVITTLCAGMKELLTNGEHGVITENNRDALERGIEALISQPEKIKILREKSANRGAEISLENSVKEIEELING